MVHKGKGKHLNHREVRRASNALGSVSSLAAQINREHRLSRGAMVDSLRHAVRAGLLLLKAKAQVPHGAWARWIDQRCQFRERTARLYMQLARDYPRLASKSATVADLTLRQAVALLAEPKPEPESPGREPEPFVHTVCVSRVEPQPPAPLVTETIITEEPAQRVELSLHAADDERLSHEAAEPWSDEALAHEAVQLAERLARRLTWLLQRRVLLDERDLQQLVSWVRQVTDTLTTLTASGPWSIPDDHER